MSMNEIKEKAGEILRQYKILHKDKGELYMVYSSSGDVKIYLSGCGGIDAMIDELSSIIAKTNDDNLRERFVEIYYDLIEELALIGKHQVSA